MGSIEIRVWLGNGREIAGTATDEQVLENNFELGPAIVIPDDIPPHQRALRVASTALAYRMEKATGFWVMFDGAGRWWIVRASEIVAGSVSDPADPEASRTIGFTLPKDRASRDT